VALVQHVCLEPHAAQGHEVHDGEVKYCRQLPDTQVASGPQAAGKAMVPHAPQWSQSVLVSTQLPLQSVVPDGQAATQPPM
jgi:hypothetical protein